MKKIKDILENPSIHTIFFSGIGGISMSSLAMYAISQGKNVLGSDIRSNEQTEKLINQGITIYFSHDAENVKGIDLLVASSAIMKDNIEVLTAKANGIPVLSRAEYLGAIMESAKTRIGIAGCHGKSTVTGMIGYALLKAKKDPSILCGANLPYLSSAYRFGNGEFLFEACEYKDSFLNFTPNVAVALNVGFDHVDYFKDLDAVKKSFAKYAAISSEAGGSVITNADDKNAMDALKNEFAILFGIKNECDYKAVRIQNKQGFYSFDVEKFDEPFLSISLNVPGYHNIYNALAAVTVLDLLGIEKSVIEQGLCTFSGISRRMEKKGKIQGATVYSDYAHHPDEIASVITTAKEMTNGRVIVVFEPHTYSRLKKLYGDFVKALNLATLKIVTDIYAARETNDLGMNSKKLASAIHGIYAKDYAGAIENIKRIASDGDIVLVLGAGPIDKLANNLTE